MSSQIIHQQLQILNTKPSFFGKIKVRDHLNALDQIGELGSPYNVQYIIYHVFSDNHKISQKTASVIRKLLTKQEVAWHNLYASYSTISSYYYYYEPDNIFSKEKLKSFVRFIPEEAAHLYGIASLNHSGYIREEALNYLAELSTPEILPYILLRLNDWVPNIRTKANEILAEILPNISVMGLIKYHTLIDWLGKTKRINLKEVQSKIFKHINSPKNKKKLLIIMREASYEVRLFCWKVLSEEIIKDDILIDKAINDYAPGIRQWAAAHLPDNQNYKNRISVLLNDTAIRVRYTALKSIPKKDFLEYKEFYEAAIFDNVRYIREYARFTLSSHGDNNYADKYRKKLFDQGNKAKTSVIVGFVETATQEDISLIKTFINHPIAEIRAAVLYGLNRLKVKEIDNLYLLGLQDSNTKVRYTCFSILQSGYSYLRPELEKLLRSDNFKLQKAVIKVLVNYGTLDSLKNILFTLTCPSQKLQAIAWQYLASWHSQYSTKLGFNYNEDTYKSTIQLLGKLRETNI